MNDLMITLGQDEHGKNIVVDLATLPHLLIGGATGSGKTVCIKSILAQLMRTKTPGEVKFIIYDEKCVEFSNLTNSPYLLNPVITDPQALLSTLEGLSGDFEKRSKAFRDRKPMPRVVVVADEYADLMVNHGEKADPLLAEMLVKARSAGVHFIFATQRPDEIVLSAALRCGFPGRMAFKIYGREYSDLLIEGCDAESLNGRGEFLLFDAHGVRRGQGVYIANEDFDKATRKKIDFIGKIGVSISGKGRTHAVMITYQGEDDDEGKIVRDLPGPCVSYLETGFLVCDERKWYFYNVDGTLVKTELKAELGECVQVSGMGDFYLFDRTKELRFLNGGEFSADVDVLCVDGEGSRFPYSNFRVGISNEELFVEEDDDEYFENPLSCPSWVELKKQTQRVLAAQQKSK